MYHPDEPSKVEQVMTGTRNLRHPVLMLTVADGAVGWLGVREDGQAVAETGRWLSGGAMAVAVGCLGAVVTLVAGWVPGLVAGGLALGRPWFFEASQMFKEDAWHLATLGLVTLMAVMWSRRPGAERSRSWAGAFGCVLGLAVGARYYAAIPALLLVGWVAWRGGRWWAGMGWTLAGCLGVFGALHGPWLGEMGRGWAEIGREVDYFARGHFGVGETVPHPLYWKRLEAMLGPMEWGLIGLGVLGWGLRRRWEVLAVGVGVWLYLEAISWSPKFSDRYFLPVEWFWAVGLGVGLGMLG
ncbi:MAG: hypothetical protein SNJ84_01730, partial [Verrucomicrobiia bacterium]